MKIFLYLLMIAILYIGTILIFATITEAWLGAGIILLMVIILDEIRGRLNE